MSKPESKTRVKDQQMIDRQREEFFSPEGKAKAKKRTHTFLIITFVVALLFGIFNWGVISDWGAVKIERMDVKGYDQEDLSILIYSPKTATAKTPAPCIICYHGNSGSGRNHESWAVEFARRGFVVLCPDLLGAGNSSDTSAPQLMYYKSVFDKAYQTYDIAMTLDYVDNENIIVSGHSLGGTSAFGAGAHYGAKAVLSASDGSTAGFTKKTEGQPIYTEIFDEIWTYTGNVLITYGDSGKYDGLNEERMLKTAQDFIDRHAQHGLSEYEGVKYTELGSLMGSFEEGNAWMFDLDHRGHEGAFVTAETIEKFLDFGMKSVDNVPNYIDPANQVWQAKDYLGFFGAIAFGLLICAIALTLIEDVPFFAEVKRAPVRNIGMRGLGMAISCVLAIAFPFIALKTGSLGLQKALIVGGSDTRQGTGIFHLTFPNYAFAMVIAISLLGIIGIVLFALTDGKKAKLTFNDLGLTASDSNKFSLKLIWKTLLLTIVTIAISFALLQLQETISGTTFYAWFFGFKAIAVNKIGYYIPYIIIWIICFIISCISINIERRLPTTGNETLDTVLQIVFNVVMTTLVLSIAIWNEWHFDLNGIKGLEYFNTYGAQVDRLYGMPLGMIIGGMGSTLLFKKTRNTWLSAMLMGTTAALMACIYGQIRIYPM